MCVVSDLHSVFDQGLQLISGPTWYVFTENISGVNKTTNTSFQSKFRKL